ncbi:hypothetical protein [Streptomyces sp. 2P-4]|uniref:hypothetical protein n=1 Tax=Streptomyces sp. 2P-4 TaxID=2931974 RepID=UPI002541F23A|nr:hypothetical protein [Streptomyces sp. 2P-4]
MSESDLFRPWGVVTAAFWTGAPGPTPEPPGPTPEPPGPTPEPPGPTPEPPAAAPPASAGPPDVPARIAVIAALAAEGSVDQAVLHAEQLDTAYGAAAGTPATALADIREVRGYLASLAGDTRAAVGWYLDALRLRAALQGPAHPDTGAAVRRTYSLWRTVADPALGQALGAELLATAVAVQGRDSAAARRIRAVLADPAPDWSHDTPTELTASWEDAFTLWERDDP